jgi:small subunit ribosomal protein S16
VAETPAPAKKAAKAQAPAAEAEAPKAEEQTGAESGEQA